MLARTPVRVLASVGPVPSDVVVAGSAVPAGLRDPLARGLESLRTGTFSFQRMRDGHSDLFEILGRQASDLRWDRPRASTATSIELH